MRIWFSFLWTVIKHTPPVSLLFPHVAAQQRRRQMKAVDKVESVRPSCRAAGCPVGPAARSRPVQLLQSDSPSEGSSEGSSQSDEPSFCGIPSACSAVCNNLSPPSTRAERRALRRRRPKASCAVGELLLTSDKHQHWPITVQDFMNRKNNKALERLWPSQVLLDYKDQQTSAYPQTLQKRGARQLQDETICSFSPDNLLFIQHFI